MRSDKGSQDYEEYDEDDFSSKRDGPSSNTSNTVAATGNAKDKNNDKTNAIRSKHSVTEQRRRSKINERFQILRDLIPHSDQKRDTASFLSEVIDYVKYLQEKAQKYEGSYPGWGSEPAKLMPWRNIHWHSFSGQPHATKNGSGPASTFPGKLEENHGGITSNMLASTQNTMELEAGREVVSKCIDQPMPGPIRSDGTVAHPLQGPSGSDLPSVAGLLAENLLNQTENLSIEGGTISISSVYSQGLLNTLTDALQSAGVDLSQSSISVQIDLGKRANRGQMTGTSIAADQDGYFHSNSALAHVRDPVDGEEIPDQAHKRHKT